MSRTILIHIAFVSTPPVILCSVVTVAFVLAYMLFNQLDRLGPIRYMQPKQADTPKSLPEWLLELNDP